MLVLSRRLNEKIFFPDMKTSVQVVALKSGAVRLGIQAPSDVTVLRDELDDRAAEWRPAQAPPGDDDGARAGLQRRHRLACEKLKDASIGLGLARLQLELGQNQDIAGTLAKIQDEIQQLRQDLEGTGETPTPRRRNLPRTNAIENKHANCQTLAGCLG